MYYICIEYLHCVSHRYSLVRPVGMFCTAWQATWSHRCAVVAACGHLFCRWQALPSPALVNERNFPRARAKTARRQNNLWRPTHCSLHHTTPNTVSEWHLRFEPWPTAVDDMWVYTDWYLHIKHAHVPFFPFHSFILHISMFLFLGYWTQVELSINLHKPKLQNSSWVYFLKGYMQSVGEKQSADAIGNNWLMQQLWG